MSNNALLELVLGHNVLPGVAYGMAEVTRRRRELAHLQNHAISKFNSDVIIKYQQDLDLRACVPYHKKLLDASLDNERQYSWACFPVRTQVCFRMHLSEEPHRTEALNTACFHKHIWTRELIVIPYPTSQVEPDTLGRMLNTRVDTVRDIGPPRLLNLQTHFASSDVRMRLCFTSMRDCKVMRQRHPEMATPDMSDSAFKDKLHRQYCNVSLRQISRHTSLMSPIQPPRASLETAQICNMHEQYAHTLCIIGRGRYQFNHGYLNLGHFDRLLTLPMRQTTRIAITCSNQTEADQEAMEQPIESETAAGMENALGEAEDAFVTDFNHEQQNQLQEQQLQQAIMMGQQQQQQPEEIDHNAWADPDEPASEDFVTSDPDTPTDPDTEYQPPSSETTADTD